MRFKEKKHPKTKPEKWFAWYPVYIFEEKYSSRMTTVWLEYVMREGSGRSNVKYIYTNIK